MIQALTLPPVVLIALGLGALTAYYSSLPLFGIALLSFFLLALLNPAAALYGLIGYLPFQVALNIAPGFDLASVRVLILILFSAWALFWLRRGALKGEHADDRVVSSAPASLLVLCFLLWSALSLTWAFNVEWGLRKLAVFASIFPLYFLVSWIAKTKEQVNKIVSVLVASATVISVIALMQFFAQFFVGLEPVINFWSRAVAPLFYGQTFAQAVLSNPSWLVEIGGTTYLRAISLFPDPHMLAFYLEMTLPLAFAMLMAKPSGPPSRLPSPGMRKFQPWRLAACVVMALALLLTFSRGGYLGVTASVAVILFTMFGDSISKQHVWRLNLQTLGVLFGFMLVAIVAFGSPVGQRFLTSFSLSEGSNMLRVQTWRQAAEVISSAPVLGVGLGSYAFALNPDADYRDPIYAHNAYLDIWAELGIFGLIAWLLLGAVVFALLWKRLKAEQDNRHAMLLAGFIGSLAAFGVHSLFETPIFSPVILPLLMIVLALAAKSESRN